MGKSELSKKLLLKQILEKDVGVNALPPSFVQGCIALERRREKIKGCKKSINRIMNLADADASETANFNFLGKKKRKKQVSEFDWEDFVIETLLLYQVGVEETEKGHYNTLLDLHVFNSLPNAYPHGLQLLCSGIGYDCISISLLECEEVVWDDRESDAFA
ncbi:hypothetical protein HS088_TW21G00872 [Tripterygium wilfordii]|uniref:Uncharacterized protein n=1 Tax=Tripterygium wilfordii TaxID=458696 RepID=A0A7J7C3L7_TRIWF|nr:hypothetical protein HS088_TW21G00872 [Tripterygium wilfordii]